MAFSHLADTEIAAEVAALAALEARETAGVLEVPMVCAHEVAHGKPHPEGYLTTAARLGAAPAECVVVENAPAGLAAAHAAGMRALAVPTTHPPAALNGADLIAPALSPVTVRVERSGGSEVMPVGGRGSPAAPAGGAASDAHAT